jgi:hypothetical protein
MSCDDTLSPAQPTSNGPVELSAKGLLILFEASEAEIPAFWLPETAGSRGAIGHRYDVARLDALNRVIITGRP